MIRGSLEGSIYTTCPAQRRRCCKMVASTQGSRARLRISFFESRSSHRVLSSCLNFLCWKLSRRLMSRRYKVPSFAGIEMGRKNDGPEHHDFGADGYRMIVEDAMAKVPICTVRSFYVIFNILAHVGVFERILPRYGK